jgi:ribosome biogenesis GTPase A
MEDQQESLKPLFATLAIGDLIEVSILKRCIVFIGLTRVGKSTVFNWFTGRQIIGKRSFGRLVYENLDSSGAAVSASALSKTLIPNVYKVND